jgi:hypothetical protein
LESPSDLPVQPDALEALSTLILVGGQTIPAEIDEAIHRWVSDGGHLVLSVGSPADYAELPMSSWLPIEVERQPSRLRDLTNLATQLPGSQPIRVNQVESLRFTITHGEVLAATLDGPLWARVPVGFGAVTLLGVDIGHAPLAGWESLPMLCERLVRFRQPLQDDRSRTAAAQLSESGVSDLYSQLVTGLDQFSAINKPGNWTAMGLILVYLLLIGPIDYLIVHKVLKRPHWTWVTFPLMVLAAAGTAAAVARERNPQSILGNQVDLVDLNAADSTARVHSWATFTSPRSQRYEIRAALSQEAIGGALQAGSDHRLAWSGIPETGFRGMNRMIGFDQWKADYSFSAARDRLDNLPVSIWSSASLEGEWNQSSTSVDEIVISDLRSLSGQLTGTVTNQLAEPMQDWIIAHEGRVYLPQARTEGARALQIAPGETLDLMNRRRIVPRVLQSFLTGVRRQYIDAGRDRTGQDVVATRDTWDPLSRDPYQVLRMASFYEAGDGAEFTSLENNSLSRLDLSPLLDLNRAILFCRVDPVAVEYRIDGSPLPISEHQTVLRIVLPVQSQ